MTPTYFLAASRSYFREGKRSQIMVLEALIVWAPRMGNHTRHHVENKDQERRDPLHEEKAFLLYTC
jgi:hypothetical protein